MLKQKRQGRCIILTTHFMEEAEVLADQIGIMSFGRLVCGGSPEFLKHRFGTGYALTIALEESLISPSLVNRTVDFVKSHIPTASLVSANGGDVTMRLPLNTTPSFPKLFSTLESDLKSLNGVSFGVAMTTLEDVFLTIARRESDAQEETALSTEASPSDDESPMIRNDPEEALLASDRSVAGRQANRDRVLTGQPAPLWQQLKFMLKMRTKLAWRSKFSLLASLLYPVIICAVISSVSRTGDPSQQLMDLFSRHSNGDVVPLNITGSLPLIVPTYVNSTGTAPSLSSVHYLFQNARVDNNPYSLTFPIFEGDSWSSSGFKDCALVVVTSLFVFDICLFSSDLVFNRTAEPFDGMGALMFDSSTYLNVSRPTVDGGPTARISLVANKSEYATNAYPTMANLASNLFMSAVLRQSGTPLPLALFHPRLRESVLESYVGDTLKLFVSSWPFLNSTNSTQANPFIVTPRQPVSSDQAFLIGLAASLSLIVSGVAHAIVDERQKKRKKQLELAGSLSNAYWLPIFLLESAKILLTFLLIFLLVVLPFGLKDYTEAAANVLGFAVAPPLLV